MEYNASILIDGSVDIDKAYHDYVRSLFYRFYKLYITVPLENVVIDDTVMSNATVIESVKLPKMREFTSHFKNDVNKCVTVFELTIPDDEKITNRGLVKYYAAITKVIMPF